MGWSTHISLEGFFEDKKRKSGSIMCSNRTKRHNGIAILFAKLNTAVLPITPKKILGILKMQVKLSRLLKRNTWANNRGKEGFSTHGESLFAKFPSPTNYKKEKKKEKKTMPIFGISLIVAKTYFSTQGVPHPPGIPSPCIIVTWRPVAAGNNKQ